MTPPGANAHAPMQGQTGQHLQHQAQQAGLSLPELLGVKSGGAGGSWLRSGDSRSAVAAAAAAACGAAFCVSAGELSWGWGQMRMNE